jgi:hypothetical protein
MVNYREISSFSFAVFIICIIIGLPTFFTGCNLAVTNYCPSYDIFSGYVYQTKITKKECKISRKTVDCWDVYAYASNTLNYNQSTSTCRYTIDDSVTHESEAQEDAQKYYVGKYVKWYKSIGTNVCSDSNYVTTLWYVGVVFFSLGSCAALIGLIGFVCWIAGSLYEKRYTNLEMNKINLTV